ncbi:MAG: hypothetical protein IJ542_02545 [Clostridia bacterium]|nr:hypothetical protein [Clostridia bacterium]
MKNKIFTIVFALVLVSAGIVLAACGEKECKELQLMGAGDRIHDSYTFANTGVTLSKLEENKFEISGSVDYLSSTKVKEEFNIADDVNHVVALKLRNCLSGTTVKDEVQIAVDGVRNYDAEHLNGDDYTFIILEAAPSRTVTISVKWSAKMEEQTYTILMSENLTLKPQV